MNEKFTQVRHTEIFHAPTGNGNTKDIVPTFMDILGNIHFILKQTRWMNMAG